ncbi:MAG: hypothetical protein ACI36V_02380 [Coriobacteriales bacterium]
MSEQAAKPTGTRCKVCRHCGACFGGKTGAVPAFNPHQRCEVCLECGTCMDAWGLVLGSGGGEDGSSGATSIASAAQLLDAGAAAPECAAPPGAAAGAAGSAAARRPSFAVLKKVDGMEDDATGATPGVASACKDLGFSDLASVSARLGIKPPGQH